VDNWDATFTEQWTCSDLVDCIISYAVTKIVEMIVVDGAHCAAATAIAAAIAAAIVAAIAAAIAAAIIAATV
jgi:hypothetical protein